jgi:hypothetical protein
VVAELPNLRENGRLLGQERCRREPFLIWKVSEFRELPISILVNGTISKDIVEITGGDGFFAAK